MIDTCSISLSQEWGGGSEEAAGSAGGHPAQAGGDHDGQAGSGDRQDGPGAQGQVQRVVCVCVRAAVRDSQALARYKQAVQLCRQLVSFRIVRS